MADDRKPAPIDFYTFCLSLGSSAFVHMGDAPNPETGEAQPNLVLAQQTIDILGMLQDKTKGNLLAGSQQVSLTLRCSWCPG